MTSIQIGASFAKQLFSEIGALGTASLRLSLATLVLVFIWRPWKIQLIPSTRWRILGYGLSLGLMNLLFYLSLARIPLGIAVALEFIGPLTLALVLSRKRIDFLWAILAGLGIYLILPLTSHSSQLDPVGIALALGAGFFWAMYIVFGKSVGERVKGGQAATLGMIVASILVVPPGLLTAGTNLFEPNLLWIGLLIAIFSSALPYSLEMMALRKIDAKTFGIFMSVEPALAAICGYLFLQEKLTSLQWVALLLIAIASAGSAKSAASPTHLDGT